MNIKVKNREKKTADQKKEYENEKENEITLHTTLHPYLETSNSMYNIHNNSSRNPKEVFDSLYRQVNHKSLKVSPCYGYWLLLLLSLLSL